MNDARDELDAAISAIRQVPGYQDFFRPPTFAQVQRATAWIRRKKHRPLAGSGALVLPCPQGRNKLRPGRQLLPDATIPVEVIRLDLLTSGRIWWRDFKGLPARLSWAATWALMIDGDSDPLTRPSARTGSPRWKT